MLLCLFNLIIKKNDSIKKKEKKLIAINDRMNHWSKAAISREILGLYPPPHTHTHYHKDVTDIYIVNFRWHVYDIFKNFSDMIYLCMCVSRSSIPMVCWCHADKNSAIHQLDVRSSDKYIRPDNTYLYLLRTERNGQTAKLFSRRGCRLLRMEFYARAP